MGAATPGAEGAGYTPGGDGGGRATKRQNPPEMPVTKPSPLTCSATEEVAGAPVMAVPETSALYLGLE